mgnify:CR=1 FL=1
MRTTRTSFASFRSRSSTGSLDSGAIRKLIHAACRTQAFIDNALAAGGKVLVHCGDGISRSPAVV